MNQHGVSRLPSERIKCFKHTRLAGAPLCYLVLVRKPQELAVQSVSECSGTSHKSLAESTAPFLEGSKGQNGFSGRPLL